MKKLLLILPLISGCAGLLAESLRNQASPTTGCPREQIIVTGYDQALNVAHATVCGEPRVYAGIRTATDFYWQDVTANYRESSPAKFSPTTPKT